MKKTLTLSSIVLGCSLFALTQTSNYYKIAPSQSYQGSSAEQFQSHPSSSKDSATMSANQSASQKTTVQGCLNKSGDGMFILSDASGNSYQLNDSPTILTHFLGEEIRVDGFGIVTGNSEPVPGAMASGPSAAQGSAKQINVTAIRKIADSCGSRFGNR